jgi:hypothetical protein
MWLLMQNTFALVMTLQLLVITRCIITHNDSHLVEARNLHKCQWWWTPPSNTCQRESALRGRGPGNCCLHCLQNATDATSEHRLTKPHYGIKFTEYAVSIKPFFFISLAKNNQTSELHLLGGKNNVVHERERERIPLCLPKCAPFNLLR